MLFPKPGAVEGHSTVPTPVFLSGERGQAVLTSTLIPPERKVEKVNKINYPRLNEYLYVTIRLYDSLKLTLPRSKYYIELSHDLDDIAVSLLIKGGLKNRFPTPCVTWESQNSESKEIVRRDTVERKKSVDEELKRSQPLLEDILAREMIRRILEEYPYVSLTQS
jgi:hypothetical protein